MNLLQRNRGIIYGHSLTNTAPYLNFNNFHYNFPFIPILLGRKFRTENSRLQSSHIFGSNRSPLPMSPLDLKSINIAVVGGGISGSVCASQLASHGFQVSLFDMGRGLGGRISQRREKRNDGSFLLFDHGAPYFTATIPSVQKFIESWKEEGIIEEWKGKFGILDLPSLHFSEENEGEVKFVGVPGMNSICDAIVKKHKILLNLSTQVSKMDRISETGNENVPRWKLICKNGQIFEKFDAVVLCAAYKTFQISFHPAVQSLGFLKENESSPCFAAMLAFSQPLAIPYDGLKIENSKILSLITRDSSKPKRKNNVYINQSVEDGSECWVLHSTSAFAQDILKDLPPGKLSPASLDDVASILLSEFRKISSEEIPSPVFMRAHRWGGAFPKKNVLEDADSRYWFDKEEGLAVCGDFCSGPNVESAIDSALKTSSQIVSHFTEKARMKSASTL